MRNNAPRISVIFAINVSWWFLPIPLIWISCLKEYFHAVAWQCFSLHIPSLTGIHALRIARTHHEAAIIYDARGSPDNDWPRNPSHDFKRIQVIGALLIDTFTVVANIVDIVNLYQAPAEPTPEDFVGASLFFLPYPSLPVEVIGVWLQFRSRINLSVPLDDVGRPSHPRSRQRHCDTCGRTEEFFLGCSTRGLLDFSATVGPDRH